MQEYVTTDLYTICVLLWAKHEYLSISSHGSQGKIKQFHFEDTPELQETIKQFNNGKLLGNIRDFRDSIETVKSIIHNHKG